MKILIAQATILAYLTKNPDLHAQLPADEVAKKQFVGERLGAAVPYFKAHPNRNEFFVTADDQCFHAPEHAALASNHAQTLDVKIVCHVYRSDVADALAAEPGAAEQQAAATGNDYGSMTVAQLKDLLTERKISYGDKDNKARLVQLLIDNPASVQVEGQQQTENDEIEHTVTQEDLDNNPELVAKGVKVGDVITINKKDLVPAPAEVDYEKLTVAQLKEEAKKLGIIVIDSWKKADIIAAIKATIDGTGNVTQQ